MITLETQVLTSHHVKKPQSCGRGVVEVKDPLTQAKSTAPRALAREAPYLHTVSFGILLSRCESAF